MPNHLPTTHDLAQLQSRVGVSLATVALEDAARRRLRGESSHQILAALRAGDPTRGLAPAALTEVQGVALLAALEHLLATGQP